MKNNPMFMVGGAFFGLLLSIVLLYTQDIDFFFYLSAAPLYLDLLTLKSNGLISFVTFVYFIVIFSFVGFLISSGYSKRQKALIVLCLILVHVFLAIRGGREVFVGLPDALKFAKLKVT